MASFLDKLKINTALDEKVKLDLSSQHISTANFMQYNVAWTKELVPKEKISVNMQTFTRMDPLPVPTFGRAAINNRAFFVPFRTIFPAWNDFITDTRHSFNLAGSLAGSSQLVTKVPVIKNSTLVNLFFDATNELAEQISTAPTAAASADFVLGGTSYKFTALGRQFYKQLCSLGYAINWSQGDVTEYSALPLIALCKVYTDWYWPSAYQDDARLARMEAMYNFNSVTSATSTYSYQLTETVLKDIVAVLARGVNYDSDYFVSAWDNPLNPNSGNFSNIELTDITNSNTNTKIIAGDDAPQLTASSANPLTQYGLTALRALTDYMKRHQLVGAKALDRYLARFGVNLPAEKMNRSVYLGSQSQPIQIGDVTSTASTDYANLGNYAGKGMSYGDGNFEFETDEYGIMIIISSIVPKVGYYQGVDRNVMHVSKLDYYTPEFDNLGTQPITKNELWVTSNDSFVGNTYLGTEVFGFTPRYAEYKVGHDRLTGDFRAKQGSIGIASPSWHLMREIEVSNSADIVHGVGFVRGLDADQYSRIFYNDDLIENVDKFKVIYDFNVTSFSPMKSMFDTYDFEDKGKTVVEDVNGVKMN